MPTLLIATNNPNKRREFSTLLANSELEIKFPAQDIEVDETGATFAENSLLKAQAFRDLYPDDLIIGEDSGLMVDALDGRPGVFSKRYGDDDQHRMEKMLAELEAVPQSQRTAHFQTVICLLEPAKEPEYFIGTVDGLIAQKISGQEGFGYDPIFIPEGYDQTFAELGQSVKDKLSHRARAVKLLMEYLI